MRKLYWIFTTFALLFATSCNGKTFMKIDDIPLPAEASDEKIDGAYETGLDNISNKLLKSLKDEHKSVEDKIFTLSKDAEFSKISKFYNDALAKEGFKAETGSSKVSKNHVTKAWTKSGYSGKQKIVVAFIKTEQDGKEKDFLNVFLAE